MINDLNKFLSHLGKISSLPRIEKSRPRLVGWPMKVDLIFNLRPWPNLPPWGDRHFLFRLARIAPRNSLGGSDEHP